MKNVILLGLMVSVILLSCGQRHNSNRFDDFFSEKNIEVCAKVLSDTAGIDIEVARQKCRCVMEVYFSLDSNIVNMSADEFAVFSNKHWQKADSICGIYMLKEKKQKR